MVNNCTANQAMELLNLDDSILIKIFTFLNVDSLLSSSLVCKRFNDIIKSQPDVSKALTLHLSRSNKENSKARWTSYFDDLIRTKIEFETIEVDLLESEEGIEKFIEYLEFKGNSVKKLTITRGRHGNLNKFGYMLKLMPNLNILKAKNHFFQGSTLCGHKAIPVIKPIYLENLKKLSFVQTHYNLLRFFANAPIKSFDFQRANSFIPDSYVNLIESWSCLESLDLKKFTFCNLFDDQRSRVLPFKLKRLSFDVRDMTIVSKENILTNLKKFLKTQETTLNELEMRANSLNFFNDHGVLTIFTDLHYLRKLSIDFYMLFYKGEFLDLSNMSCVKELEILTPPSIKQTALYEETYLSRFPELEIIRTQVYFIPSHWLHCMTFYNPKITEMYALPIEPQAKTFGFERLKIFRVKVNKKDRGKSLIRFLEKNPSIETLSIELERGCQLSLTQIEFLINRPNLRQLKFLGHEDDLLVLNYFFLMLDVKSELFVKPSVLYCLIRENSTLDVECNDLGEIETWKVREGEFWDSDYKLCLVNLEPDTVEINEEKLDGLPEGTFMTIAICGPAYFSIE